MENELRGCGPYIIRKKTNSGELSKTYCWMAGSNKDNVALFVDRYILSMDETFSEFSMPVKRYKNYILYRQFIAIRYSTLHEIFNWVLSLNVEKEFK